MIPTLAAVISPYFESVTTTGCIFAIAGVGLYITIASGQFSIAHAAIMGLGGYMAALTSTKWGQMGFWPSIFAAAGVGAICGLVLALMLLRMGGMLLAVATLAIGVAVSFIIANIDYLGGSLGFPHGIPVRARFWPTVAILAVILLVLSVIRRSTWWLSLVAVGKDETVAEALGISVVRTRLWGFGIGGALAGLGGGLLAQFLGFITPSDLGFQSEAQLFIYVIIGGVTTPWGAVLGGIGINWLLEALRFSVADRFWILGLLLTLVVLLRPQGILVRSNVRARGPGEPLLDLAALRRRPGELAAEQLDSARAVLGRLLSPLPPVRKARGAPAAASPEQTVPADNVGDPSAP